jgi:ATP-dependent helicase/nuclease subunit B
LQDLIALAQHRFDAAEIPVEYAVQWWPRFEKIAGNLLDWHRDQIQEADKIYVELSGDSNRDLDGFVLRGRVDRIDLLKDGRLAIFDYKTGVNPNVGSMLQFKSPQLPLEAAMAKRGGFGDELARDTAQIGYIRLRPAAALQVDVVGEASSRGPSAAQLSEEAWQRLGRLVAAYRDANKDYRSKARQAPERNWQEDYDHLARVKEWAVTDDQEGEA